MLSVSVGKVSGAAGKAPQVQAGLSPVLGVGSIVCFVSVSVGKVTAAAGKALLVHAGLSLVLGALLVCCVLSVCVSGESNWCSWQSKAPLVNRQLGAVPAVLCTLSDRHGHRNGEERILTWRGTVEGRKEGNRKNKLL